MSGLVTCHKAFLEYNTNILKWQLVFILFVFVLDYNELHSFLKKSYWSLNVCSLWSFHGADDHQISNNSRLHQPLGERPKTTGGLLLIFLNSTHDQIPQQTVQLYSSAAHPITYLEMYLLQIVHKTIYLTMFPP
jgi:hypothetical protein